MWCVGGVMPLCRSAKYLLGILWCFPHSVNTEMLKIEPNITDMICLREFLFITPHKLEAYMFQMHERNCCDSFVRQVTVFIGWKPIKCLCKEA